MLLSLSKVSWFERIGIRLGHKRLVIYQLTLRCLKRSTLFNKGKVLFLLPGLLLILIKAEASQSHLNSEILSTLKALGGRYSYAVIAPLKKSGSSAQILILGIPDGMEEGLEKIEIPIISGIQSAEVSFYDLGFLLVTSIPILSNFASPIFWTCANSTRRTGLHGTATLNDLLAPIVLPFIPPLLPIFFDVLASSTWSMENKIFFLLPGYQRNQRKRKKSLSLLKQELKKLSTDLSFVFLINDYSLSVAAKSLVNSGEFRPVTHVQPKLR